jgi:uncharacterized protein (TIGR00288 family)
MAHDGSELTDRKMALYIDLENLVLGVREAGIKKFKIKLVLQRMLEKGNILSKRAFAAWRRFEDYKRNFHEHAIEMLEIPGRSIGGKNSADIKMVVDVMDVCYKSPYIDTFVIASGDSDFSPLVSKLREYDKYVIGIGVKQSTSELLRDNCDEFIYYGDLVREDERSNKRAQKIKTTHVPKRTAKAGDAAKDEADLSEAERRVEGFKWLIDGIHALLRNGRDTVWGSMVKQTVRRKNPSFDETYYGYKSFSEMLEDAQKHKILTIEKDERSGYRITGVAELE